MLCNGMLCCAYFFSETLGLHFVDDFLFALRLFHQVRIGTTAGNEPILHNNNHNSGKHKERPRQRRKANASAVQCALFKMANVLLFFFPLFHLINFFFFLGLKEHIVVTCTKRTRKASSALGIMVGSADQGDLPV